jgi:uncharacterized protein (TIGR00369 family)
MSLQKKADENPAGPQHTHEKQAHEKLPDENRMGEKLTGEEIALNMTRSPFLQLLGIRLKEVHEDGITLECALRPELQNAWEGLHGGVYATMCDAAVAFAIQHHVGARKPMATVDLKVNYFLPVKEGKLLGRARLLRVGATLAVGSVELMDEAGRAVGTALVTYMFLKG